MPHPNCPAHCQSAHCPKETARALPERPDLIEIHCPHHLEPLRYERREASRAAR